MPGDCRECGACCFSDSDTYVRVTEDDARRLGRNRDRYVRCTEGEMYLRMELGRCAALENRGGLWVCSIYRHRPLACHELQRGSPACLEERHLKLHLVRASDASRGR